MKTILVHFADGFEEIEALTPVDVLRRAGYNVIMVSVTGKQQVSSNHNIGVNTDMLFEDADYEQADVLIMPGGMPGAATLNAHEGLRIKIAEFNQAGKFLAAICAGPMVLGQLGILSGKTVTCYPGFEEHMKGAKVTKNLVEKDGNIITGKGPGAAMKFAFTLVEILSGKGKADELKNKMMVED